MSVLHCITVWYMKSQIQEPRKTVRMILRFKRIQTFWTGRLMTCKKKFWRHSISRIYSSIYHQIYECYIIYGYVGVCICNMNVILYTLYTIFHRYRQIGRVTIQSLILRREPCILEAGVPLILAHFKNIPCVTLSQQEQDELCFKKILVMENQTYSAVIAD